MPLLLVACSPLYELPQPLLTQPREMQERLSAQGGDDVMFSATARVDYYSDGKARKGKLFIMAALPHRLRLEAMSFTDDMLSLMVVDQNSFGYFERGHDQCYAGPLCAAPVVARFPMASNPGILLPLLLGRVPLLHPTQSSELTFDRTIGLYRLTLTQEETTQQVLIAPADYAVREFQLTRTGSLVLKVTYSGALETSDGRFVPQRARLVAPDEKLDLSIEYRQFDWEQQLESSAFEFRCPEGARLQELDCGGAQ